LFTTEEIGVMDIIVLIGLQAIFITAHKLEPPTYAEGFDTLYYVRIGKDSTRENPAWEIEKI
jgi:hypothetical protein